MQTSQFISKIAFFILPDFTKIDGTHLLLNGQAIPNELIFSAIPYVGMYLLAALFIGWIGFKNRNLY